MKLTLSSPSGNFSFETKNRETVIGRGDTADWVIQSDKLSRAHCVIYVIKDKDGGPDRLSIKDPGSKNGITVDGKRINLEEMTPVSAGTIVVLANIYILTFGENKKAEMIDLPGNAHLVATPKAAPKKARLRNDDDGRMPVISRARGGFFSSLLKFVFLLSAVFCTAVYFLIFK